MTARPPRNARRRGLVALLALAGLAMVLMFIVASSTYTIGAYHLERTAELQACAEQLLQSARSWCEHNGARVGESGTSLPAGDVIPADARATVELHLVKHDEGDAGIECRVMVIRGRETVRRSATWRLHPAEP